MTEAQKKAEILKAKFGERRDYQYGKTEMDYTHAINYVKGIIDELNTLYTEGHITEYFVIIAFWEQVLKELEG